MTERHRSHGSLQLGRRAVRTVRNLARVDPHLYRAPVERVRDDPQRRSFEPHRVSAFIVIRRCPVVAEREGSQIAGADEPIVIEQLLESDRTGRSFLPVARTGDGREEIPPLRIVHVTAKARMPASFNDQPRMTCAVVRPSRESDGSR